MYDLDDMTYEQCEEREEQCVDKLDIAAIVGVGAVLVAEWVMLCWLLSW
jgi:hypothetical protein